ncbi:MAG: glycosyl hydrolase 115 family protein [Opitutaceae bacterium]
MKPLAPASPSQATVCRVVAFAFLLSGPLFGAVDLMPTGAANQAAFPLVAAGSAAPIVIPPNAPEVVRIAARDFANDIARVTGRRPEIVATLPPGDTPRVLVADSAALAGRWEAFRLSASANTLVVEGADRRALAYGLYELSKRIGVSPWHWWGDVPVAHRDELRLSLGDEPVDQPAVKYRGIFLNDEGWGLVPWAARTHEPEVGNLGPKTYGRLFELLLRLRANTLWPAMHPGTTPFHRMPGNAALADAYAIVVGSSHAEPMLRNNVGEWTQDKDLYNYATNRAGVLAYWEERVKQRTAGESLFTLGMRGIHDSPIVGFPDQAARIPALERIVADQRALLARHLGHGDPTRVAQIFCPYKEVLADYEAGLRVPDDVTIVWPDDNFGYIRRFGSATERARAGGLGVYYHASYLGAPLSWLWLDSLSPALVWSEMTRAYEHGAHALWIVNVGDLKGTELSAEFFLDLAWHADRTGPEEPRNFLHRVAARDFGAANAAAIADLWARHQHLAAARKPEHLQWHLPLAPYRPTELTEAEILARLAAYAALRLETEAVAAKLPPAAGDAFFERVAYPIKAAAAANDRYFLAELARLQRARGEAQAGHTFEDSEEAEREIERLTAHYNDGVAGGRWRYIVTPNGLSPRQWRRFQPDPALPPLSADTQSAVQATPPTAPPTPPVPPVDARPGDFFEHEGVVSIDAGHFTSRDDLASGAGWRTVPGLGRTGSAVTVLPSMAAIETAAAPRLSYRFHIADGGPATVHLRLLPTFPLASGTGLRLRLAVDNTAPQLLAITDGFEPGSDAWKERVLTNAAETSIALPAPLAPGWHTLHLVAVDPGVVVDKLVLDLGGLRPSYDGPAETRVP